LSPNSFTFSDDVASRAEKNNGVENRKKALTHAARNVRSKTLSAGGVGVGCESLVYLVWPRRPAEASIHKHGGG
jgi:hypothetical protein